MKFSPNSDHLVKFCHYVTDINLFLASPHTVTVSHVWSQDWDTDKTAERGSSRDIIDVTKLLDSPLMITEENLDSDSREVHYVR